MPLCAAPTHAKSYRSYDDGDIAISPLCLHRLAFLGQQAGMVVPVAGSAHDAISRHAEASLSNAQVVRRCHRRPGPTRCLLNAPAAIIQWIDCICQLGLQVICHALALGARKAVHNSTLQDRAGEAGHGNKQLPGMASTSGCRHTVAIWRLSGMAVRLGTKQPQTAKSLAAPNLHYPRALVVWLHFLQKIL